jgi:hypothetical protein
MKHLNYFALAALVLIVLLFLKLIQWGLVSSSHLGGDYLNFAVYGCVASLLGLISGWFVLANK